MPDITALTTGRIGDAPDPVDENASALVIDSPTTARLLSVHRDLNAASRLLNRALHEFTGARDAQSGILKPAKT